MVVLILATVLVGIALDVFGGAWGQPIVNLWVGFLLLMVVWKASPAKRFEYLLMLIVATAGELFLSQLWKLYEYRLGAVPLFVIGGHVLVNQAGAAMSTVVSWKVLRWILGAFVLWTLWTVVVVRTDELTIWLAALAFPLFLKKETRHRYGVILCLCFALEIYGVTLGCWRYGETEAFRGWKVPNPPAGAGFFYCYLDSLTRGLLYLMKWRPGRGDGSSR